MNKGSKTLLLKSQMIKQKNMLLVYMSITVRVLVWKAMVYYLSRYYFIICRCKGLTNLKLWPRILVNIGLLKKQNGFWRICYIL